MKHFLLCWTSSLVLGCASAEVTQNRLAGVPAEARVNLASVVLESSEPVEDESAWVEAIRRGFEERAEELDLAGGPLGVEIRITACDPGSQALRYWVGFGAGSGKLESVVNLRGHGELVIEGGVGAGFWGGSFKSVCEKAGRAAAQAIHDARGK